MTNDWIINSAKTVGRSHLRENPPIPCQDSVSTIQKNNTTVLALSDGCGSSKISEIGSDITTKVLCNILVDQFDDFFLLDELEIKKKIIASIIESLKIYLSNNPSVVKEYAKKDPSHYERFIKNWNGIKDVDKIYPLTLFDATVQFVAEKNGKVIIGRLGDGVIGSIEHNNLKIMSMEDKVGIEENATWYPTTIMMVLNNSKINPWEHFEIQKIENGEKYSMFFIASDGVGDVLIGNDENTKFLYADEIDSLISTDNLFSILENRYKTYKGIYDDLSVAFMKKNKTNIDAITIREYDKDGRTISNEKKVVVNLDENKEDEEKLQEEELIEIEQEAVNQSADEAKNLPFDEKYEKRLKRYTKKDPDKYDEILKASIIIWNSLKTRKMASYDEIVCILETNADIDDVTMYAQYWKMIKLFRIDQKKKIVEMI